MPLNRTNDQQNTEMAIFMWKRCPAIRAGLTKKQLRQLGAIGQVPTLSRMAENYVADLENTTVCKNLSQKGWDLENRTEVKTAATSCGRNPSNPRFQIQFMGLTNKEDSDHIIAVVYNDVLSKTQVLKIPNSFYRDKTSYSCGVNRHTGNINGLQQYIIDEG